MFIRTATQKLSSQNIPNNTRDKAAEIKVIGLHHFTENSSNKPPMQNPIIVMTINAMPSACRVAVSMPSVIVSHELAPLRIR